MEVKILYSRDADYHARLKTLRKFSAEISKRWKIKVRFIDASRLSGDRLEEFKSAIRSIPPQVRGKIVSSRNYRLPLSNGRNLNIANTPIALVYNGGRYPLDVYPISWGRSTWTWRGSWLDCWRRGPQDISSLEA